VLLALTKARIDNQEFKHIIALAAQNALDQSCALVSGASADIKQATVMTRTMVLS